MAITKVFAIHSTFQKTVQYAANEEKTSLDGTISYVVNPDKTEQRLFESCLNCSSVEHASLDMERTKQRYHKRNGVQGYHIIQSFKPGELTPEQTHEIGVKFAQRLFGDRFEVVIGTHLDRQHLHNHIAVNSVSFVDGRKLRCNMKTYFQEIQKVSDDLCREYGLSVIQPRGKGKSRGEWQAAKEKKPTIRAQIRRDIDGIIGRSLNFTTFLKDLRSAGYEVRYDRRKYTAVKPPYGKKFIRLDSLGENYTDAAIERRILAQQQWSRPKRPAVQRRYFCKGTLRHCRKHRGFSALYFRYVYLLRGAAKGHASSKVSRYLLEDTIRFETYLAQHRFLTHHHIETAEQLQTVKHTLTTELNATVQERKPLYEERRYADESKKEALSQDICARTAQIKILRRNLRLCAQIEADAARVQSRVQTVQLMQKEERYHESRQRSRRTDDARGYPDLRGCGEAGSAGSEKSGGAVSGAGEREPEAAGQDPHERPASQRERAAGV